MEIAKSVQSAIKVLKENIELDDDSVIQKLISNEIKESLAIRLVNFTTMAFLSCIIRKFRGWISRLLFN